MSTYQAAFSLAARVPVLAHPLDRSIGGGLGHEGASMPHRPPFVGFAAPWTAPRSNACRGACGIAWAAEWRRRLASSPSAATHRHCHVEFQGPVRLGPGFTLRHPRRGHVHRRARRRLPARLRVRDLRRRAGRRSAPAPSFTYDAHDPVHDDDRRSAERCVFGAVGADRRRQPPLPRPDQHILDQGYDYRPITIGDGASVMAKCTVHRTASASGRSSAPTRWSPADPARTASPSARRRASSSTSARPSQRPDELQSVAEHRATDLAVVIPTRERWTSSAARSTRSGADGARASRWSSSSTASTRTCPTSAASRVVQQEHGGPGAARNNGVAADASARSCCSSATT